MRANGVRSLDVSCWQCHHRTIMSANRGRMTCRCRRSGRGWCAPAAASSAPMCGRTGGSGRFGTPAAVALRARRPQVLPGNRPPKPADADFAACGPRAVIRQSASWASGATARDDSWLLERNPRGCACARYGASGLAYARSPFRLFVYWFFILVFTFAPAFLAITHAAASGTRSLWYYVLAGMGVTLFALVVSGFLPLNFFFPSLAPLAGYTRLQNSFSQGWSADLCSGGLLAASAKHLRILNSVRGPAGSA
jgi:hypothetical protein